MRTEEAPRIFSSDYYERMRQLEAGSWWNAGMRDIAARLFREADLPETGRLLDVGCGSGQTMSWFLENHSRWTAAGADVAADGVAAAHSHGLTVATGNALVLPFADGCADLIVTLDVLQHLPLNGGDVTSLAEMRRVLRPGGYLFIRTNCQAFPRTRDDPANDFRKYTPQLLEKSLRTAGFNIVRLSRANSLLGLAEVARELRATKAEGEGYHGLLAVPGKQAGLTFAAKRAVLRAEASFIARGAKLPLGRSIVAMCRKPLCA
jgi:SAM-dependent methyltransferase